MDEYNVDAYLIKIIDCYAKMEALFASLDMAWLDEGALQLRCQKRPRSYLLAALWP